MAQLNNTLNQEEILQLLENNTGEGFRKLLQDSLNAVLKAESSWLAIMDVPGTLA